MATEMNKTYNPSEIEDRLYKKWMDKKYFHAEVDRSKKPAISLHQLPDRKFHPPSLKLPLFSLVS